MSEILPELMGYDWTYVFSWSSNMNRSGNGCSAPEPAAPGIEISCEPFDESNVVELFGCVEGENDGPDWIAYGRLDDGRFFSIRAGCDYTGWDCRSGGSSNVAPTKELIEKLGLSDEERARYAAVSHDRQ